MMGISREYRGESDGVDLSDVMGIDWEWSCCIRHIFCICQKIVALKYIWLVGGLEHFLFSHISGIIIQSSIFGIIFFRGVAQPPIRSIDYP